MLPTEDGTSGASGSRDAGGGAQPYIDLIVPSALDGERLDRVISMLSGCSRTQAAALVGASVATVDDVPATKVSLRLSEGDRLVVARGPRVSVEEIVADPSVRYSVVLEDRYLAVIDKPAGLVVHPGAGNQSGTLVNGLVHMYPDIAEVGDPARPGIVHRLDSGTSGLMVVAKDPLAYEGLVEQLSQRSVRRVYTTLVYGHPQHGRGIIDAPIGRSHREPLKMTVSVEGRQARTHYEVDQSFDEPAECSLLTCRLETGRTHQIRVHLASIGNPVVGDTRYGGTKGLLDASRPFLHARELGFTHPVTGEDVRCSSGLPEDLSALLDTLV